MGSAPVTLKSYDVPAAEERERNVSVAMRAGRFVDPRFYQIAFLATLLLYG